MINTDDLHSKKTKKLIGLGVFADEKCVYLYFHSPRDQKQKIHVAVSTDGTSFEKSSKSGHIRKNIIFKEDISKSSNFSISSHPDGYTLLYVRHATANNKLLKATSKDLYTWNASGYVLAGQARGVVCNDYHYQKQQLLYAGSGSITVYASKNLTQWNVLQKDIIQPREGSFDSGALEVEAVYKTEKGILLFYHSLRAGAYTVGVALFDKEDPTKLLWRSNEPLWSQPETWKHAKSLGSIIRNGVIVGYWQVDDGIFAVSYGVYKISDGHSSKDVSLQLKRSEHNPMIRPNSNNAWEAFNTFNPAAVYDDGKVHLLYRAQGYNYVSVLGYATSLDGERIHERDTDPIYLPTEPFEYTGEKKPKHISHFFMSGGGYGGCEDPRMTKIDGRYYLTYVAFDGYNPPRVALSSISSEDFLSRKWNWDTPVLISPPGVVDKSAVIFPEKINGKYVIMHRIYPHILIDYVDDLNFDGTKWLEGKYKISPRPTHWDSRKIGAGAPPIKTKYGWLLIYQSVGEQDSSRYKIGAMLLDLNDPTKVLHRSQSPILEPDVDYENKGFKSGVIYPCGAAVIDDTLYVYYGGADSYVCVAKANLEEFLKELRFSEVARLSTPEITQITV